MSERVLREYAKVSVEMLARHFSREFGDQGVVSDQQILEQIDQTGIFDGVWPPDIVQGFGKLAAELILMKAAC